MTREFDVITELPLYPNTEGEGKYSLYIIAQRVSNVLENISFVIGMTFLMIVMK